MQVQKIQNNNTTFGTKLTPRFAKALTKAIENESVNHPVLQRNLELLHNDGKNIFFDLRGDKFCIRMEDIPETLESLKNIRNTTDSEVCQVLDDVISPNGDDLFLSAIGQGVNKAQKVEGNAFSRLFEMLNTETFVEKFNTVCDRYRNALKKAYGSDFDMKLLIRSMTDSQGGKKFTKLIEALTNEEYGIRFEIPIQRSDGVYYNTYRISNLHKPTKEWNTCGTERYYNIKYENDTKIGLNEFLDE